MKRGRPLKARPPNQRNATNQPPYIPSETLTFEKHVNKPAYAGNDRYAEKKTRPKNLFEGCSPNRWPLLQCESKSQTMVSTVVKIPK